MNSLLTPRWRHSPPAAEAAREAAAGASGAQSEPRHRVVIVGAGFGGLAAAQTLAQAPVEVTVVDRQNHHLFQPLLYQVATAALSPAEIAQPIRSVLKKQVNTRVLLDAVTGIDVEHRLVQTASRGQLPYDSLIIGTGARHSYFGKDEWAENAPGIKSIDDATMVRRRILLAFERAEAAMSDAERDALLTFVVVGAGPTGVELSGAIAELARHSIVSDFRTVSPQATRILLVEAAPRILGTFPDSLAGKAQRALTKLGVEVLTDTRVEDVSADGVVLNGQFLACRTVVWAAGVRASPAADWLGAEADRAGRVIVAPDFSVPGHPEIFVIGDTATYTDKRGRLLPGVAPVAKQAGHFVGHLIAERLAGRPAPTFRYRDLGNLATVGRKFAIMDFGRVRIAGLAAWLLWCVAHIWFLIGFRNRVMVSASWVWSYLTWQRGVRLITGLHQDDS
jgi:NADH dehydrogenase